MFARSVGLLVLCSCATAHPQAHPQEMPRTTPAACPAATCSKGPLPAGLCGFEPFLAEYCERRIPTVAVVLGAYSAPTSAERALAQAAEEDALAPGYPFAATAEELPLVGPTHEGMLVVLGLFDSDADASALAGRLDPKLGAHIERVAPQRRVSPGTEQVAVELLVDAPAWTSETLETVERRLDEALVRKWVDLGAQAEGRARALRGVAKACTLRRGSLFIAPSQRRLRFRSKYAPVTCPDGRDAWVMLSTTRDESVVHDSPTDGLVIDQVIHVECDAPYFERRALPQNTHERFWFPSCEEP